MLKKRVLQKGMVEMRFIKQRTWNPEGKFKLAWMYFIASSIMFLKWQIFYNSVDCFM